MISFAFDRDLHWLYFDILDPAVRFLLFGGFYFGKIWKIWEKRPFFRADTAGLGKNCMGGYGRFGVYREWKHGFVKKSAMTIMRLPTFVALSDNTSTDSLDTFMAWRNLVSK